MEEVRLRMCACSDARGVVKLLLELDEEKKDPSGLYAMVLVDEAEQDKCKGEGGTNRWFTVENPCVYF